jgi:NAD(P)-dependent dehydrogenase (short-subunit alcohol dehydrogenase family)
MRLSNRRTIVTGAADGIGRAIATAFADEGAIVIAFDLDRPKAEAFAAEITAKGGKAIAVQGSVASASDVEGLLARADEEFGGVDILVNNAGVSGNMPSVELTDEFWDRVIGIDLTGVFRCSRAAGRRMIAQGSGIIINIASIFGDLAAPARLAYCAAKAGVCSMTKVLAIEWATHGIRVNAVAPGYIQTALVDDLVAKGRLDIEPLRRRTPMRRLGTPKEIADLCVFLATPEAAFITGQIYAVDGGWSAYGHV